MLVTSARPYSRCTSNLYSSYSYCNNNRKVDKEMGLIAKKSFPNQSVDWNEKILRYEDLNMASEDECKASFFELLRLFTEADEEDPKALYEIARCYFEGKGLKADGEKGVRWLQKAAESKYPAAINDWGRFMMALGMSYRPFGVCLIVLAATKKCPDAEMNLGLLYETGIGMRQNLEKSLQHYKNAQALDSVQAAKAIRRIEKKISSRE